MACFRIATFRDFATLIVQNTWKIVTVVSRWTSFKFRKAAKRYFQTRYARRQCPGGRRAKIANYCGFERLGGCCEEKIEEKRVDGRWRKRRKQAEISDWFYHLSGSLNGVDARNDIFVSGESRIDLVTEQKPGNLSFRYVFPSFSILCNFTGKEVPDGREKKLRSVPGIKRRWKQYYGICAKYLRSEKKK